MAIYIKQGSSLIEMTEQRYDAERVLQQLLTDHPNLLVGNQDAERRKRWLLIKAEMGVASEPDAADRWSLDHLFVDEDAVPTLVEVKRSTDTRIRREVVGQMLDYAANATRHWSVDRIRDAWVATQADPDGALVEHLGPDADPDGFWADIATNLRAGRLRLVFVADRIPGELRSIIEFLNEQMPRTEVLGIEVKQYLAPDSDLVTLVPTLIGQTELARETKRTGRQRSNRTWSEQDLIDSIRRDTPRPPGERLVALYEWMRDQPDTRLSWGRGRDRPSVTVWLGERGDGTANPVAVNLSTDTVGPWVHFLRDRRSPAEMQRLADLLRQIPDVAGYLEGLEERNWGISPSIRAEETLATDEQFEAWKHALAEASAPPGT